MTDRKLLTISIIFILCGLASIWLITEIRNNSADWEPVEIVDHKGQGGTSEPERIRQYYRPGFICPVKPDNNRYVTSVFGIRFSPITGGLSEHLAVDITGGYHAEILAAETGLIHATGYNRIDGYYVTILHNDGYRTRYCHLSRVYVKRKQVVEKGDVIGRMGNTGVSTGEHLHFEIWQFGAAIDPLVMLPVSVDEEGRF